MRGCKGGWMLLQLAGVAITERTKYVVWVYIQLNSQSYTVPYLVGRSSLLQLH